MNIIQHTTYYMNDYNAGVEGKQVKPSALLELMLTLFEQYKQVAQAHAVFLGYLGRASEAHKVAVKPYDIKMFWTQVQAVVRFIQCDIQGV